MIQPNRLQQAQQELQTITHYDNNFSIPNEIPEQGSKNHYHIIGVRSSDTADKFGKIYRGKKICISINQYNKMQRQVKTGILKSIFGGTWQKIVILHDPTMKPAKKEKKAATNKPKGLSPKHKKAVNEMKEEGKDVEQMADILGIDVERIKAYLA